MFPSHAAQELDLTRGLVFRLVRLLAGAPPDRRVLALEGSDVRGEGIANELPKRHAALTGNVLQLLPPAERGPSPDHIGEPTTTIVKFDFVQHEGPP
jgi:hypothetical protein